MSKFEWEMGFSSNFVAKVEANFVEILFLKYNFMFLFKTQCIYREKMTIINKHNSIQLLNE